MYTAAKIKGKSFEMVKNGFDPDEVRFFLAEVSKDFEDVLKSRDEGEEKLVKLAEKLNEYREDEDAIKNALILSQKESNKIINEAKAQARDMIESAKSEQTRLTEQSAAECERIISEHKENCAKLIKENTEVTQKKIADIRAEYDKEQAALNELKQEVTKFKAQLLSLYKKQLALVMEMPSFEEEKPVEAAEKKAEEKKPEAPKPVSDKQDKKPENKDVKNAAPAEETREEHLDKILNTGSFEPVIPKKNLQDLKFGKNK